MKILFVAPWLPSEQRPRSLRILELLSQEHDVSFVGLRGPTRDVLFSPLPAAETIIVEEGRVFPILRVLLAIICGRSLQEAYGNSPKLRKEVLNQIREKRPDVVHMNVYRTVHLAELVGNSAAVVVDLDEFRSTYYEQLGRSGRRFWWRSIARFEAKKMSVREQELLRKDVDVLVSGPREVRQSEAARISVLRSIVPDMPYHRGADRDENRVLFVGRLSYEANVEGLEWFIRSCWEELLHRFPDLVLDVVGADPPSRVRRLRGRSIFVHGAVPSLDAYYASASVAIVPIFRGTGVQMKLVQALTAGVPSVCAAETADRAGLEPEEHVLTAEGPHQWIDAISRLLEDASLRQRLSVSGRSWARGVHSPEAVGAQLEYLYSSIYLPESRPRGDSA